MSAMERRVLRSLFTKEATVVEELISNKGNESEIRARFSALTQKCEKLKNLDDDIVKELLQKEGIKDEAIEEEMTKSGEYEVRFLKIKEIILERQAVEIANLEHYSQAGARTQIRFPKIELKKFDGDLRNWIGFWGQFEKIHDDESLADEDKFEYLRLAMKTDSPAHKLIDGFPPSKENYNKAVDLLKSRYGKEEFLIEFYVRELLSLVLQRRENMPVTQLYDRLETQLRALDSLGVTKEKYAAMLFPLVESAIPEDTFKVWERHRVTKNTSAKNPDDCLNELLEFLKVEIEGEERLKLRMNSFETDDSKTNYRYATKNKVHKKVASAAALISSESLTFTKEFGCIFCSKSSHNSQDCAAVIDSSMEERNLAVKKTGACFRCLKRGHLSSRCKTFVRCAVCKGKHYAIMCKLLHNKKTEESDKDCKQEKMEQISMLSKAQENIPLTYLQTLIAYAINGDVMQKVRILFDSGSQRSYITKECAKELRLETTGKLSIRQELFGGKKTALASHDTYTVSLKDLGSDFRCEVNLIDQDRICSFVPNVTDVHLYQQLKDNGIELSDFSASNRSKKDIQILLGADVWARIITKEFFEVNKNLLAIKTRLGWSLLGSSKRECSISSTLLITLLCNKDVSKLWDLEVMGIRDPGEKIEHDERDREVLQFFKETVTKSSTGRYIVKLPWTNDHSTLVDNREAAERRLKATTCKLRHINKYVEYDIVFQDWLKKGMIEVVEDMEPASAFYLPHRAVLKENSTTPVRPVFDASARDKNGHSLNESLEKGPNLIELVPLILMNFRKHPIGLSADIEKAFLQIELNPDDRNMLRFLWWKDDKIIIFRHCRVVFGVTCSPFLLGAVINHLLENAPCHLQKTAEKMEKSFYVDNCLTGVKTVNELDQFINEAEQLMSSAGFNLRGWVSSVSSENVVENVLGLQWFCSTDELGCNAQMLNNSSSPLTKRTLLSCAQKVFDPIGVTAPAMLLPKIMLQSTWNLKLGWDKALPEDICKEFYIWMEQIKYLNDCKVTRRIIMNGSSSLHVFCDASKVAFASCVFLRTEIEGKVFISLVIAKSRVAPTKILTIPRLELMAAVVGVRLCSVAKQGLNDYDLQTYFWSDSTVTLAWIMNQGPWSVFIENRVKEIKKYSHPEQWRHVPGNMNPSDLLSRGCMPKQLLNSKWWEGPSWLLKDPIYWPSGSPIPIIEEVEKEKRRTVITAKNTEVNSIAMQLARKFSKFSKMVRTVAWILRFRPKVDVSRRPSDINGDEFATAEKVLLRCIQLECFSEETSKTDLKNLHVYTDGEGILRMRSRLIDEEETGEYICPLILPSKHPVVERMIEQHHVLHKHAGTLTLLTILREKFWILRGRRTVGSIVRNCVVCRKNKAKSLVVPYPPLPKDRTTISATFQVTGVDLAGPLFTRNREKCWVVIFTCAVYRAVHLELIQSLSSGAFIQALRRFIARRGRISVIYSDNGTNFVGVNRALNQLDWNEIQRECGLTNIRWKFNPPTASWWGGFWERLIGILKDLLRKNLGRASLNYDELITVLCECESVMNNRPLTYVSEEPDELRVLKPSMFLHSLSGNEVTDLDQVESISLAHRWQYLQRVRESLRRRFKKEYLGFLRSTKRNRTDTIQVGDIVLVGSDDKKRLDWSLARVIEVLRGKDNINRLVRVKTSKGCQLRPVQRLFPLEIRCEDEMKSLIQQPEAQSSSVIPDVTLDTKRDDEETDVPVKTRYGRAVRPPRKLSL